MAEEQTGICPNCKIREDGTGEVYRAHQHSMSLRNLFLVSVLLLVPTLQILPGSVRAQETDVDRIVKQAETDAGNRRYEEAVQGYLRAHEISGSPNHLYNISVLYLARLDDPLKAWEYAMQFKEQGRSEVDREDAEKLIGLIEDELKKRYGEVIIHVVPENAGLWLDRRAPEAVLPRKTAWVSPGPHVVIGSSDGFDPGETSFEMALGGESEVSVVLKTQDAVLKVSSNVPRTWLWVGTEKVGITPVSKSLKPGLYHIRAEAEGYRPLEQEITLTAGETRSLKAKLTAITGKPVETPLPTVEVPVVMAKPPGPEPDRTWAWVSFGGSGAALITGTVLYFVGRKDVLSAGDLKAGDFPGDPESYNNKFDSRVSKGKSELYAGYACWGLSGAALVTAIALYFTADDVDQTAGIAPMGPGGPGMTAMIRW